MIGIIDYGVGNLFSLESSLKIIGAEAVVTGDAETIRNCDRIILPGVGAFRDAIFKLRQTGLDKLLLDEAARGKELMGICLGMQLLFERSFEYGQHQGLGLLKGDVIPLEKTINPGLKIPHIGWNALEMTRESRLLRYVKPGEHVYFVHSYHVTPGTESLIATTEYGGVVSAAAQKGNVMGCQFHPEKSGDVGMKILKAFAEGAGE